MMHKNYLLGAPWHVSTPKPLLQVSSVDVPAPSSIVWILTGQGLLTLDFGYIYIHCISPFHGYFVTQPQPNKPLKDEPETCI